jgi:hypothetical protein
MSKPIRGHGRRAVTATTALLVVLALALAGCGSSGSSSSAGGVASGGASATSTTATTHFAKTKFVLHAGLAFGAFHHFIWKPYKAGDFRHPTLHKFTVVKAAVASAFVYHELKLALHDAQSSPTLAKLVSPITALDNRLHNLGNQVRSGSVGSSLSQDNGSISSIEQQSSQAGQPIQEQTPASP